MYLDTYADFTFLVLSEVYDLFHLLCIISCFFVCVPTEVVFRSRVIGACPVTTECIVAMSSCENNNCSTPIVPRVACKNNTAKYHSRDTTLFPSRLSTKTWGAGPKRGNLEQKTVRLALSASRQTTKSLIAAMKKSPCATNACEEYLLR